jgi:hypothetical protein
VSFGGFSIKNALGRVGWQQVLQIGAGFAFGAVAWRLWEVVLPAAPMPLRFAVSFTLFVAGPGSAAATILGVPDAIERAAVTLSAGLLLSAALAQALGEVGWLRLFPFVATGLGGAAVAGGFLRRDLTRGSSRRDLAACVIVAALVGGAGAVAYAHRMTASPEGLDLNGDYDTFDSSYYAAISADLATEIPPDALFYAGHRLGYAYHTQLLPAMVFRFGRVPLMDLYFGYTWPAFLTLAAVVTFAMVRRIASTGVAVLSVVLVFFGSDLSYLIVAVFHPHHAYWDHTIWSNNWLTPGAEQLYFNTWTPALVAVFLGLWTIARHEEDSRTRWIVLAAASFASLVQIKPFGFAPIVAGLLATAIFARRDRAASRRALAVLGLTLVFAAPYLYGIRSVYQESQAVLRMGIGYITVLPEKIATQLHVNAALLEMAKRWGGGETLQQGFAFALAVPVFLIGGVGVRLLGVGAVWRAITGNHTATVWRLMAWSSVAGAAIPLAFVTEPYHQTFHPFHLGLFFLWIFTARTVVDWGRGQRWRTAVAVTAVVLVAVPSTVHYLRLKWSDVEFGFITNDTVKVGDFLRSQDPARTVFIARYPQGPSFLTLFSQRRTVLAWAQYVRDSAILQDEIEQFFQSAKFSPAAAWELLRYYHVTHVVETVDRDHIHEAVRCRLQPVFTTPTLRVLAVPAEESECGAGTTSAGAGVP